MLELGAASKVAHYDIGQMIAKLALDYVGVVGEFKEDVVQGALEQGFSKERVQMFEEKKDAIGWIKELVDLERIGQDDVILVKASRGLRFETIVAEIIDF
jgi:UDP-N-acetylmuramyl pentapeptide synthase